MTPRRAPPSGRTGSATYALNVATLYALGAFVAFALAGVVLEHFAGGGTSVQSTLLIGYAASFTYDAPPLFFAFLAFAALSWTFGGSTARPIRAPTWTSVRIPSPSPRGGFAFPGRGTAWVHTGPTLDNPYWASGWH